MRIIKTSNATDDLDRIVAYIARDNLRAALQWLEDLERLIALLAEQPQLGEGVKTKEFGKVRRRGFGNYLIYFRATADELQILSVLHAARDQERLI